MDVVGIVPKDRSQMVRVCAQYLSLTPTIAKKDHTTVVVIYMERIVEAVLTLHNRMDVLKEVVLMFIKQNGANAQIRGLSIHCAPSIV